MALAPPATPPKDYALGDAEPRAEEDGLDGAISATISKLTA
eukprot:SAG31_NODE_14724_length_790_cov_1.707670_1_plen_40_part_01